MTTRTVLSPVTGAAADPVSVPDDDGAADDPAVPVDVPAEVGGVEVVDPASLLLEQAFSTRTAAVAIATAADTLVRR
ncbi:hypothetical protein GIS00_00205 [Nakamurella sp. YIM 132087]|uniref:Uncharacterized protein n=1 Tax=Nakamurella alba TaxID=2665158 RepID=A0A7K1FGE0_9ACTN|nr:hypothetical protein [Nakamurella alba]MTD12363.1 hypothetical protein [Nakamurella alba]